MSNKLNNLLHEIIENTIVDNDLKFIGFTKNIDKTIIKLSNILDVDLPQKILIESVHILYEKTENDIFNIDDLIEIIDFSLLI